MTQHEMGHNYEYLLLFFCLTNKKSVPLDKYFVEAFSEAITAANLLGDVSVSFAHQKTEIFALLEKQL